MYFAKVPLKQAEKTRAALLAKEVLDVRVKVETDEEHIYFPLTERVAGYTLVEREPRRMQKPQSLTEALQGSLTAEELTELTTSYDIVGSIAILEVSGALAKKEKLIAQAVLDTHKHVTTVLKKAYKHSGEFRTQKLQYLAGEDTRETVVNESGCRLLVDVEQVYFSVRLSTERLRIASLVKPGEDVLVMFSGAGPYVVVLAKKTRARTVVGVEKNPVGHQYAIENLRLNKLKNAEVFNHDCKDLSFLQRTFDRIIMPLPSHAEEFLEAALAVAKDGATIHLYRFGTEEDLAAVRERIAQLCQASGWRLSSEAVVKAGHHAPYVYRWCFDFVVHRLLQGSGPKKR